MSQPAPATPAPFEIASAGGVTVASNGAAMLTIYDAEGGRVFRRRGITASTAPPPGEAVLPLLNALAGDLLQRLDMPAPELAARLTALAHSIAPRMPVHHEWAVGELDGVRVYFDGATCVMTRHDLTP